MKLTTLTTTAMALTAFTLSLPAAAATGEVVEFAYLEGELATLAKAAKLLERIKKEARDSCEIASPLIHEQSKKRCANDLTQQFVTAIGNAYLTRLAEGAGGVPYRSAAR